MNDIINLCLEKGFLVEPDIADILKKTASIDYFVFEKIIDIISDMNEKKILTKNFFVNNFYKIKLILENIAEQNKGKKESILKSIFFLSSSFELPKEEKPAEKAEERKEAEKKPIKEVKIIESYHIPGKKLEVEDFVRYFRKRFITIKNFLQDRKELENLTSINKITSQRQNISLIAIVFSKRYTKNKNLFLEVEDLTGRTKVIVHHSKECFSLARDLVEDDIIGLRCSGNNEILFVNDIILPDIFAEKKKATKEEYALFTADLHVGSNNFMEKNFLRFVDWINGKIGSEKQKNIAEKIKYLFILGDIVDGVGIYPGQEEELVIKDVTKQYDKVADLLSKIRKDITIIICPGNHDAVRIAEPQPLLNEKYASSLYNLKNIIFVSNPSFLNIASTANFSGIDVLLYHGHSFEHYANNVDQIRLKNPQKKPDVIMDFLLKRRHLAPTHGSVPYIPSEQCPMIIKKIPNIFASGEMHKSSISYYNNILNIACSCWQEKTPYQEKVGHEPDPCKVPLLNLHNGKINILDFS